MALDDDRLQNVSKGFDESQVPKNDKIVKSDSNSDLNIDIGDYASGSESTGDGLNQVGDVDNIGNNQTGSDEVNKNAFTTFKNNVSSFFKSLVPTANLPRKAIIGLIAGSLGITGIGSMMGLFSDDDGNVVLWDSNKPIDTDCMDEFTNNVSKYLAGQGNDFSNAQTMANAKLIYSYFKGAYNMSDEKIAAALGNLEKETGTLNPALIEGNDSGRYSVDPMDPVSFSDYSEAHKGGSIYYNVTNQKGGYSAAVGIGIAQLTGDAAVDYLLNCKATGNRWDNLAYQLAYCSMKNGYRTANTWLGGPGTPYTNFFEYFANMDYRSSEAALSGKHVGFGTNLFATGSFGTKVTSAFDGQDVDKLSRIFCAGFLGWKPESDYAKRSAYARKWLAVIKTFNVDSSFANSVLSMANVSANKARGSLLNPKDCLVTSTNYDNSSIAMAALSMAYDSKDKAYNDGTPLYRRIFNAIIGSGPSKSCASLVASAVLWSGVDDEYPRSNDVLTQVEYLFNSATNSGKWKLMNREIISGGGFDDVETIKQHLQPGDILVWKNGFATGDGSSGSGDVSHICVYTGNELATRVFGAKAGTMNTVEASYSNNPAKQRSAALGELTSYRTKSGSASRANFQVYRCIKPQKTPSKYKSIGVEGSYNGNDYVKDKGKVKSSGKEPDKVVNAPGSDDISDVE